MTINIKLSIEEKFLINLIFKEEKIPEEIFNFINYELLTKIASSHLMIPALYVNLRKKKYLRYIPQDFKNYIYEIYLLNKERNKILIKEVKDLCNILDYNKIEYALLKGSAYIFKNIYSDIGERMIGDIDFLINNFDLNKTTELLKINGYKTKFKYKIWKTKHTPRYINQNKIFALEPHSEALIYRKRRQLYGFKILRKGKQKEIEYLTKICVLNFQINDYGHLRAYISHRTIYDFIQLTGKKKIDINNLKSNYYKRFFLITDLIGITNYQLKSNIFDKFYLIRFKLKKNYKLFYIIDNIICNIIEYTPKRIMQIIEFSLNKKYRKHVIEKISQK